GAEPGPEMLDGLGVLLDDARGVAPSVEVGDVEFDPVAEEVGPDTVTDARSAEELVQHGSPPFGSRDRPGGSRIMRTDSNLEQRERRGDRGDSGDRPPWTPHKRGLGIIPLMPSSALSEELGVPGECRGGPAGGGAVHDPGGGEAAPPG